MKRSLAFVIAGVLCAAGCASSSGTPDLTQKAAATLAPYVQQVRVAASGKSRGKLNKAINTLRTEVTTLQNSGEVTASRAAAIDNAAGAVLVDFDQQTPPSPPATPSNQTSSPSVPPTTPPPTVTATVTVTPTETPTGGGSTSAGTDTASP
jgi:hypothetical protein